MLLLSLAAVKHTHTLVLRCGGEDNTLTAPREGGGGREREVGYPTSKSRRRGEKKEEEEGKHLLH